VDSTETTMQKRNAILAKPTTDKSNSDIYRSRLLDLRSRLRGEMGRMADAALGQGRSETSSLPIHLADLGSDNFEQELTLSLVGSEKEALDKIEVALERIAEGSYGKCEECGKKIPESRLEAIPYTAVCVQCASVQEQQQRGNEE
jgi:DnaK suppressor protein